MTLFRRVVELLTQREASDIVVFGGGIIPDDDMAALKAAGVKALFKPGAPLQGIVDFVKGIHPHA
jgi:methylmalonyl-CoA mutase C-terminal domain/subunit